MRFTDRERVAEITMRTWDGESWGQDFSADILTDGKAAYDEALDAYLVNDLDYVIDYAKDWQAGTGDFRGCGAGESDELVIDVRDVIEDYDQTAASLYDGGWRAEDRDALKDEYDFTDAQVDRICEKLAEYAAQ